MKAAPTPLKSAVEEIEVLHHLFRSTLEAYAAEVERGFTRIRDEVEQESKKKESVHLGDGKKMVARIRKLKIEPEQGKRRDLKKIEALLKKLDQKVAKWQQSAPE